MKINFSDGFKKKYIKLNNLSKDRVNKTIKKFKINPFDQSLCNHNLQGRLKGFKSIKAGFDLRLIFKEEGGYIFVLMIDVGKHDDVY